MSGWYRKLEDELFNEKHSIAALYFCLLKESKIQLEYNKHRFLVSSYREFTGSGYIVKFPYYKVKKKYINIETMFNELKIDNKYFVDLWKDIIVRKIERNE